MKNLLAVVGDGNAAPVLETSLLAAERFNSHIVGLHSLTTEYAVVFGGEMGFSISSEVGRPPAFGIPRCVIDVKRRDPSRFPGEIAAGLWASEARSPMGNAPA